MTARRAPVPMMLQHRPSAFVSVSGTALGKEPSQEPVSETALGGLAENDARAAIEADGYKKVRAMNKAADGTWRARALRGATEVALRVDSTGNVSAD